MSSLFQIGQKQSPIFLVSVSFIFLNYMHLAFLARDNIGMTPRNIIYKMKCQSCENHCENQNPNNFLYNKDIRPFPVRRRPFCENAFKPKFYFYDVLWLISFLRECL